VPAVEREDLVKKILMAALVLTAGYSSVQAAALDELKTLVPTGTAVVVPATPSYQPVEVPATLPDVTPGRFDLYVLALSWEPAFCTTTAGAGQQECAPAPERFSDKNLILHGLWPGNYNDPKHTYNYCGVDAAIKALDRPATWNQLPPVGLSDGLQGRMAERMPGTASHLERHEWYTHGVCSGLTAEEYFDVADGLVVRFAASRAGRFLSANVGGTVSADALLAEFEADFGPDSAKSIRLYCLKDSPNLIELRVSMKHSSEIRNGFGSTLVTPDVSERGNCPAEIRLLAPSAPN